MSNTESLEKENETLVNENIQLRSQIIQLESHIAECSENQIRINNWMKNRLSEIDIEMREMDMCTRMITDILDDILYQVNPNETITIVDTTNGSTPSRRVSSLALCNSTNSSDKSTHEESSKVLSNSNRSEEEDSPELARNKSLIVIDNVNSPDDSAWVTTIKTNLERSPIKTRSRSKPQ